MCGKPMAFRRPNSELRLRLCLARRSRARCESRLNSLLIQDPQPIIARIRLDGWLIHQACPSRRDAKFAGHLDSHGILERRVAVKIVLEDDRAIVAKLAVAVPIRPLLTSGVVQIDTADLR